VLANTDFVFLLALQQDLLRSVSNSALLLLLLLRLLQGFWSSSCLLLGFGACVASVGFMWEAHEVLQPAIVVSLLRFFVVVDGAAAGGNINGVVCCGATTTIVVGRSRLQEDQETLHHN
jgi:hypothetical protein